MLVLALRFWKPLLLLALILALFGFGWHVKAGIDKREAERVALEAKVAEQEIQLAVTRKMLADARASREAADAARERNDREIPRIRQDTKGRVDRAATASPADELRDDQAATAAYRAASDSLRGKSAP